MSTGEGGYTCVHMKWDGVCTCVCTCVRLYFCAEFFTWRPFGKDKSKDLSPSKNPARLGSLCASGNRGAGSTGSAPSPARPRNSESRASRAQGPRHHGREPTGAQTAPSTGLAAVSHSANAAPTVGSTRDAGGLFSDAQAASTESGVLSAVREMKLGSRVKQEQAWRSARDQVCLLAGRGHPSPGSRAQLGIREDRTHLFSSLLGRDQPHFTHIPFPLDRAARHVSVSLAIWCGLVHA